MSSTTTTPVHDTRRLSGPNLNNLIPFEQITQPGTYICNWNGFLLRIPAEAISPTGLPVWNLVGPEPLFVTKISNDPYVTLSHARMIACNFDVQVNF